MITISKTQRLISTRLASKRLLSLRDGGRSAKKNLLGKMAQDLEHQGTLKVLLSLKTINSAGK